jgi:hypothetical protein
MALKPFNSEDLLRDTDDLPPNATAVDVRRALAADSARAHIAFLQAVPCLDRDEVIRGTGMPTDAGSPAHPALADWKRRRIVLCVEDNGRERYPAFQFQTANGQPHPNVARVLAALPSRWTSWQVAFWFASPNGWLDGDVPADRLNDQHEILAAARHEAEPIEG